MFAAELKLPTDHVIFPWIDHSNDLALQWPVALTITMLGLVGALITVYLSEDYLPQVGGGEGLRHRRSQLALIEDDLAEKTQLRDELGAAADSRNGIRYANLVQICDKRQDARDNAWREYQSLRRSILLTRTPIFVLLGGFVACLLAANPLQGLLLGSAWPIGLAALGVKQYQEEVKAVAADQASSAVQRLRVQIQLLEKDLSECRQAGELAERTANEAVRALRRMSREV